MPSFVVPKCLFDLPSGNGESVFVNTGKEEVSDCY